MGMFQSRNPPNLPVAPNQYDPQYLNRLINILRVYFDQLNAEQVMTLAGLVLTRYPTQTSLSSLRSGTVYVDTSAGNVLKIKP